MKTFLSAVILCALCASSAFARLGETEKEIEARYGKALGTVSRPNEPLQKVYSSAGFDILVGYIDGRSGQEVFFKKSKSAFSDAEIQTLLDANSGGGKWIEEPLPASINGHVWHLQDRGASYQGDRYAFIVELHAFEELRSRLERDKLKKF